MAFSLFLEFRLPDAAAPPPETVARAAAIAAATPGLERAILYTPAAASDPYLDDGAPPALVAEIAFAALAPLEAAMAPKGHLQALARLPALAMAEATQQAMLRRSYPVPDPVFRSPEGVPPASYLVAYEGAADDPDAWLAHYVAHHPPIMARFPGIRQIEICTACDCISALKLPRARALQRNKVVFDSAAALDAALNSPVRHEMREDFRRFPPFRGRNTHFAMHTHSVGGA
ncbi:MAG TPA: EthD family reductase [Acetobacteraceae bacterium]|nr:EthD family reductase [Acetobacteraceae bacterium]